MNVNTLPKIGMVFGPGNLSARACRLRFDGFKNKIENITQMNEIAKNSSIMALHPDLSQYRQCSKLK